MYFYLIFGFNIKYFHVKFINALYQCTRRMGFWLIRSDPTASSDEIRIIRFLWIFSFMNISLSSIRYYWSCEGSLHFQVIVGSHGEQPCPPCGRIVDHNWEGWTHSPRAYGKGVEPSAPCSPLEEQNASCLIKNYRIRRSHYLYTGANSGRGEEGRSAIIEYVVGKMICFLFSPTAGNWKSLRFFDYFNLRIRDRPIIT